MRVRQMGDSERRGEDDRQVWAWETAWLVDIY